MIECNIIQYTGIRFYSAFLLLLPFLFFVFCLFFFHCFFFNFQSAKLISNENHENWHPRNKRHPQYDISKFQAQKQIISLSGYGGSGEVNEAVCQHIWPLRQRRYVSITVWQNIVSAVKHHNPNHKTIYINLIKLLIM